MHTNSFLLSAVYLCQVRPTRPCASPLWLRCGPFPSFFARWEGFRSQDTPPWARATPGHTTGLSRGETHGGLCPPNPPISMGGEV